MERRLSSNSESSIEPLDASDGTNKSSTPLPRNSSDSSDQMESEVSGIRGQIVVTGEKFGRKSAKLLAAHTNLAEYGRNLRCQDETAGDADVDDEDDENGRNRPWQFGRLRPALESMSLRKKFRYSAGSGTGDRQPTNNNNTNKNNNNSKGSQRIDSSENSDANGNVTSSQYICPICNVCSATQHEFTEHIRGHNNSDGSHNYTCQICFKVSVSDHKAHAVGDNYYHSINYFRFDFIRLFHRPPRWIVMCSFTPANARLRVDIVI